MSGAARTLEPWRWIGVPVLQVAALTLLFAIPLRFWGLGLPEPVFALPVVFAWAVIRPAMLAPPAILLMGVFMDHLWGAPRGFWPVLLLIAYGTVFAARSMLAGRSRIELWAWYAAVTALTLGAGYLIVMLDVKGTPSPLSVGWQFLATVVLYPFADRLIERFEDADVRFR